MDCKEQLEIVEGALKGTQQALLDYVEDHRRLEVLMADIWKFKQPERPFIYDGSEGNTGREAIDKAIAARKDSNPAKSYPTESRRFQPQEGK